MNVSAQNRSFLPGNTSLALEKSLMITKSRNSIKKYFTWGSVNLVILVILLYDVLFSCPLYFNYYEYVEYAVILIVTVNILYYIMKIATTSLLLKREQILITSEQKRLLGILDTDPNYKIVDNLQATRILQTPNQSFTASPINTPSPPLSSTPMNMTAHSWMSNMSPNESLNYSVSSPSWIYQPFSPGGNISSFSVSPSVENVAYRDTSGIDFISDEGELEQYLKEFETNTSGKNLVNQIQEPSNLLSSFWSHPVTKTAKDMSSFLRRCTYQLSPQSPTNITASSSPKGKIEHKSSPNATHASALVAWTKLNVDIVTLTKWNENLRKWTSQTILERLVSEFDRVDVSLEKQGLSDIKVGTVGLDRLRKTAQMAHVAHFIPSLSTLIPFLEITTNQEYLVKRIRELAKGGCMSEFKWNGGSIYNGKDWEDSLPTDSAIVMHLLASYLDTQLMPLPSMPDTKPFSGFYYIKAKDKVPDLNSNSLFIQQVSEKPAHYRVIVGETVYEMVKGYSNLFHSILFFLYHVNKKEHGMLGRVNLGRAGVNMLWIIEQ